MSAAFALRSQAQHRPRSRQRAHDLGEGAARDGDHVQVGACEPGVVDRRRRDAAQVGVREVARVVSGLLDLARLLGVARGERDVVAARAEQGRERRSPCSGSDDDGVHERRTKSIDTGTPSSSKRSRSWFSTQ
jgi:hypothetical protein